LRARCIIGSARDCQGSAKSTARLAGAGSLALARPERSLGVEIRNVKTTFASIALLTAAVAFAFGPRRITGRLTEELGDALEVPPIQSPPVQISLREIPEEARRHPAF